MNLTGKTPYKKTPIFNEKNTPKAILEKHNTKDGVWGKIIVKKGKLKFVDLELEREKIINAGEYQVIEPTKYHRVELLDNVEFFIEFYKI